MVLAPTPELSTECRNTLLALLKERPEAAKIPILELVVTPFEKRGEQETGDESWYRLSWPCRFEALKQRIEGILVSHLGARDESA